MTDVARTDDAAADAVAVTIDGVEVQARRGQLVIDAAEQAGVYIPRFCYHPRMTPVGMCRMCLVEIDAGRGPALQPACMIECAPDMTVATRSAATKKAQDGVLEFLLINHPLDCPVCDKGGECPLQDQTMAYGPGESRFVEEKRHKEKPIPISDLVLLDRERCILCDRCTRFADEVAGDPLIHFVHRGNQTEVNTFPDHPFASYFSGNTVQICPVGALTSVDYRFRARPWDLEQAESTCQTCSVGCRVAVQTSRNQVLRVLGVDVDPVNQGWLCDKGRFVHGAFDHDDRLREPLVRAGDRYEPARWADALGRVADDIAAALAAGGPDRIAVIGGAHLTNEDAYAWAKLVKGCIGSDNMDAQLADGLPPEVVLGLPAATVDEVCAPGGVVVVMAGDLKEELPVLHLRLRRAVVEAGVRVIEISPRPTALTPLAAVSLRHRPGEAGEVARALAHGIPAGRDAGGIDPGALAAARALLVEVGGDVRVVVGRQSVAESDAFVADAAVALHRDWPSSTFLPALRRANVRGALDMGLAPGFLPGRVVLDDGRSWYQQRWPTVPDRVGRDTTGILQAAAAGEIDVLILLGADVLGDFPDRGLAARGLTGARTLVAVDLFLTETSGQAAVVLPAGGFGEVEGTTTNLEGRVSTLHQAVTPPGSARTDWMIAAELAFRLGTDLQLESVEEIWAEIAALSPVHAALTPDVLAAAGGDGVLARPVEVSPGAGEVPGPEAGGEAGEEGGGEPGETVDEGGAETEQVAVEVDAAGGPPRPEPFVLADAPAVEAPATDAYALRLVASRRLYDEGVLVRHSPVLRGLAPGTTVRVNRYDFDRLGVEEGTPVRAKTGVGAIDVELRVDDTVTRGTAVADVNQAAVPITEVIDAAERVTDLRIDVGGAR